MEWDSGSTRCVVATLPAAIADDRSDCTSSSWRATLKKHRKWIIKRWEQLLPHRGQPDSSAFGIGQLILARRRYAPHVGTDPVDEGYHSGTTNPCEQLRMMRLYIDDRYGSTKKAKKFWKRNHWY